MLRKTAILLAPAPAATEDTAADPGLGHLGSWMSSVGTYDPATGVDTRDAKVEPEPKEKPNASPPPADQRPAADKPAAGVEKPAAAPAKDEKPADKPVEKPKADDDKAPASQKDWDNYKAKHKLREQELSDQFKTAEAKAKELESKLVQFEAKAKEAPAADPAIEAKIKTLETENLALTNQIVALNVTEHPKFQKYFGDKYDAAYNEAKALAGEKGEELVKLLKTPDSEYRKNQIAELTVEMDDDQRYDLRAIQRTIREIDKERQVEIERANTHRQRLVSEGQARSQTAAKRREDTFATAVKEMQQEGDKGFVPLQLKADDTAWNQDVAKRVEDAKNLIFGKNVTAEQVARAALHAACMPAILERTEATLKGYQEKISKLEAQVKELTAAQPGPGSGSAVGQDAGNPSPKPGTDPMTALTGWTKGLRDTMNGQ